MNCSQKIYEIFQDIEDMIQSKGEIFKRIVGAGRVHLRKKIIHSKSDKRVEYKYKYITVMSFSGIVPCSLT